MCNEGEVTWKGRKLDVNDKKSFAEFKRGAQPVFQDPFSALNPKMKVGTALEEALSKAQGRCTGFIAFRSGTQ